MKGPRHFLSENLANGKQLQTEGHSIVCFILLAYNVNAHVQYDLSTTSVPDQRKSLFTKCGGAQEALDRNKQIKLVESYIKTKRAEIRFNFVHLKNTQRTQTIALFQSVTFLQLLLKSKTLKVRLHHAKSLQNAQLRTSHLTWEIMTRLQDHITVTSWEINHVSQLDKRGQLFLQTKKTMEAKDALCKSTNH